jgi:hypothetical protein
MKLRTIAIAVCAAMVPACAGKTEHTMEHPSAASSAHAATPPSALPSGNIQDTVTATATVQSVNMKNRHVVLKRPDGTKFTVVAGPEVRNLAQVHKGDQLKVTYHESIAYQVKKPGEAEPGMGTSTDVSRAPLGEKPGGKVTNTVNMRATITNIDKANNEVTLRGPNGKSAVVKPRDPSKLDQVKVGDVVDITYTEALAIAVEKASAK